MSSDDSKVDGSSNAPAGRLTQKSRWIAFWCVLSIGIVWWLTLSWLVAKTANPVTLNRLQILAADVVVAAEFSDVATGVLTVVETHHGEQISNGSQLSLSELKSADFEEGDRLLLPLSKKVLSGDSTADVYSITPNLIGSGKPLYYPATDDAIEQLQKILKAANDEH